MKVILEYDEETGQIKDSTGVVIAAWHNLSYFDEVKDGQDVAQLMSLGASVDDLLRMKAAGII